MRFINSSLTAALALALSACAGITSPPPVALPEDDRNNNSELSIEVQPGARYSQPGEQTAGAAPSQLGSDGELVANSTPLPNPYLANAPQVSAGAEELFTRALALHRAANWTEAELAWQELALSYPGLSGPLLNLGLVYQATDRLQLAQQSYQRAIEANRLNVTAYNQLAIVKRQQGLFSEAESLYQQALQVWPDHPASHRNIAILYDLYMGKLEQALAHYQRYRDLQAEPERALKGWIRDLQRRLDISS